MPPAMVGMPSPQPRAAIARPAPQQPAMQRMVVTVPDEHGGGMVMHVQTPEGLMEVSIPPGLGPGQTFEMVVPTMTSQQFAAAQSVSQPMQHQFAPQMAHVQHMQQYGPPPVVVQQAPPMVVQQAPVIVAQGPPVVYGGGGFYGGGYYGGDAALGVGVGLAGGLALGAAMDGFDGGFHHDGGFDGGGFDGGGWD